MTRFVNMRSVVVALFCTAIMLPVAQAEQFFVGGGKQVADRLQGVDHGKLAESIRKLRSELIAYKQDLLESVAARQIDYKDKVITTVMPGGLLYAGYKKIRLQQAENELARVTIEIEEYSTDLQALQAHATTVLVAELR